MSIRHFSFVLCGQLSLIICFYCCTFISADLLFLFTDLPLSFLLNLMRYLPGGWTILSTVQDTNN